IVSRPLHTEKDDRFGGNSRRLGGNSRRYCPGICPRVVQIAAARSNQGMSAELICSTLGLPVDRWPPDHYELLALPRGPADAAGVEAHVLDRMERLRRLQLAHPDAVTDAMNRLAQALVCLTDPTLKRDYDVGLGIAWVAGTAAVSAMPVSALPVSA